MRYLTLEECKAALVVEHNEDDALIMQKAGAAERAVEEYLECSLDRFVENGTLREDIKEGVLLFLGGLYNNREGFSTLNSKETASIMALLRPHRTYGLKRG